MPSFSFFAKVNSTYNKAKTTCKTVWGIGEKCWGSFANNSKLVKVIVEAWNDSNDSPFDVQTYSVEERAYARDQGKKLKKCKFKHFIFEEPLDRIKQKVQFIMKNPKNGKSKEKIDADQFLLASDEAVKTIADNLVLNGFHWCTQLLTSVITYCAQRCPQSLLDALEDALFCDNEEKESDDN